MRKKNLFSKNSKTFKKISISENPKRCKKKIEDNSKAFKYLTRNKEVKTDYRNSKVPKIIQCRKINLKKADTENIINKYMIDEEEKTKNFINKTENFNEKIKFYNNKKLINFLNKTHNLILFQDRKDKIQRLREVLRTEQGSQDPPRFRKGSEAESFSFSVFENLQVLYGNRQQTIIKDACQMAASFRSRMEKVLLSSIVECLSLKRVHVAYRIKVYDINRPDACGFPYSFDICVKILSYSVLVSLLRLDIAHS